MYNLLIQAGFQTLHYRAAQPLVVCKFNCPGGIEAFKGTVSRDFFLQVYHESSSLKPLKITLGSFQICSKICGDIRKSRCTTGINDKGGKFSTGVNYTGGKVATGFNGEQRRYATGTAGVIDSSGKLRNSRPDSCTWIFSNLHSPYIDKRGRMRPKNGSFNIIFTFIF